MCVTTHSLLLYNDETNLIILHWHGKIWHVDDAIGALRDASLSLQRGYLQPSCGLWASALEGSHTVKHLPKAWKHLCAERTPTHLCAERTPTLYPAPSETVSCSHTQQHHSLAQTGDKDPCWVWSPLLHRPGLEYFHNGVNGLYPTDTPVRFSIRQSHISILTCNMVHSDHSVNATFEIQINILLFYFQDGRRYQNEHKQ